jgi:hypothetical protein
MSIAIYALGAACALLVWRVMGRRHEYLPIALFFFAWLASDAAWGTLEAGVLAPLRAQIGVAAPWTGRALLATYAYYAIWLLPPAALIGAALTVFANRRPWPAFVGWLLVLIAFMVVHPRAPNGSQRFAETVVDLGSAGIAALLIPGLYVRQPTPSTFAFFTLAVVVFVELLWAFASFWVQPSPVLHLVLVGVVAIACLLATYIGTAHERKRGSGQAELG